MFYFVDVKGKIYYKFIYNHTQGTLKRVRKSYHLGALGRN